MKSGQELEEAIVGRGTLAGSIGSLAVGVASAGYVKADGIAVEREIVRNDWPPSGRRLAMERGMVGQRLTCPS